EGYEYGSFHFLEPSFLHNYTDSTRNKVNFGEGNSDLRCSLFLYENYLYDKPAKSKGLRKKAGWLV
ncbi:hypothetical protein ABNE57_21540, partial [Paenibacillus larvae]